MPLRYRCMVKKSDHIIPKFLISFLVGTCREKQLMSNVDGATINIPPKTNTVNSCLVSDKLIT